MKVIIYGVRIAAREHLRLVTPIFDLLCQVLMLLVNVSELDIVR